MRDYLEWHRAYDDPDSSLSWRLGVVRAHVRDAVTRSPAGPVQIVSACAGDGRDVIGALTGHPRAADVHATLLELHPTLAARARTSATGLDVTVRETDAGRGASYAGCVPADVVLLVGVLGNLTEDDVLRTIDTCRQLCRPAAALIWTRGVSGADTNDDVRQRFAERGFTELAYQEGDFASRPAVGLLHFDGETVPLDESARIFDFIR